MFVFNLKIKAKKTVILAAVLSVTAAIICTAVAIFNTDKINTAK